MSGKIYLKSERGEAGYKLLLFIIVVFLVGFAGFSYVPVAFQGANFKQEMETAVIKGMAMPTNGLKPVDATRFRLKNAMTENGVPDDAYLEVKEMKGVIRARVYYKKQVEILPFSLYQYDYVFDHTVAPTGFLLKQ